MASLCGSTISKVEYVISFSLASSQALYLWQSQAAVVPFRKQHLSKGNSQASDLWCIFADRVAFLISRTDFIAAARAVPQIGQSKGIKGVRSLMECDPDEFPELTQRPAGRPKMSRYQNVKWDPFKVLEKSGFGYPPKLGA